MAKEKNSSSKDQTWEQVLQAMKMLQPNNDAQAMEDPTSGLASMKTTEATMPEQPVVTAADASPLKFPASNLDPALFAPSAPAPSPMDSFISNPTSVSHSTSGTLISPEEKKLRDMINQKSIESMGMQQADTQKLREQLAKEEEKEKNKSFAEKMRKSTVNSFCS